VLFRLLQQGILAALAPPGAEKVDILVLSTDERITATIQVKTTTAGVAKGWTMSAKHESIVDPHAFYAFVDLKAPPQAPVTYIVPSSKVAEVLKENHQTWLDSPGLKGQPHIDNHVRKLAPTYNPPLPDWGPAQLDQFRERWDLLREVYTLSTGTAAAHRPSRLDLPEFSGPHARSPKPPAFGPAPSAAMVSLACSNRGCWRLQRLRSSSRLPQHRTRHQALTRPIKTPGQPTPAGLRLRWARLISQRL
jgi:hypothetical protein